MENELKSLICPLFKEEICPELCVQNCSKICNFLKDYDNICEE